MSALYTPEILGLAVSLASYPWNESLPLRGEARSVSCGSSIAIGLRIGSDGRISDIAIRSQACAIGQAAAAIFANHVVGLVPDQVKVANEEISRWLSTRIPLPSWPGFRTISPALDYPARHGAIALPWNAALGALNKIVIST